MHQIISVFVRVGGFVFLALGLLSCSKNVPEATFLFTEATIEDVQAAITSGESTCVDIVSGYLKRIETYDQPSNLNAIIFFNPNAISAAKRIDTKVSSGDNLGPLFCAPVLLKDNFDTADMPTSGGSIALKNSIPPQVGRSL